jgi:putative transposase
MSSRREFVEGRSLHIIQRGTNRCNIFGDNPDREWFLWLLASASKRFSLDVHGYVLMDTHFHMLATPRTKEAQPNAMKWVGCQYVRAFNRKYGRVGTLWGQRPRVIPIEDERRWLTCLRYIEQNPVRAKMVASAGDYRWSSYGVHACAADKEWLTPHPVYLALGETADTRQAAYRAICDELVCTAELVAQRLSPAA